MGGNGVSGPTYTEKFCFGTACIDKMPIGCANKVQGIDVKSGIIGLAFGGGNSFKPSRAPTFMEMLEPSLPSPVMVTNFKVGGGGSMDFGHVDTSLYYGALQKVTADSGPTAKYANSWSLENVQYTSGGKNLGSFNIVFDTGGPMTSGPIGAVRAYYAQIPGARDTKGDGSIWMVPCKSNMPDLILRFPNGAFALIPGAEFLINGDRTSSSECQSWFVKENSKDRAVIGDPFWNKHVVIFNQKDSSISWANKAF